jgi:serine phosphatase RsbU (regulator of sigma subunit)
MEAIEELVRVHQEPAQQRGERILEAITTFMQGEQPDDDMCLVVFDRD